MSHEEFEMLWLESLRDDAADTVEMLGNTRKLEREWRTCAAFLRCAGIEFNTAQILPSATEPPDVLFEGARFEIAIVLPPHRRMHEEWRATADRRNAATQIQDLMQPYHPPEILSREEVTDLIAPTADDKARRYLGRGIRCEDLDLLTYVNRNAVLNPDTPAPSFEIFARRGWRSVSVLIPSHSYVIYAAADAPRFIQEISGNPVNSWPQLSGLFEL